jgi:hypothetical protein
MVAVVVGEKTRGFQALLLRIEGAARELLHVDFGAGNVPIDLLHRDIVGDPGLGPAIESHHDRFIGIVGVARRERFEAMQRVQVAQRPGDQRRESADD